MKRRVGPSRRFAMPEGPEGPSFNSPWREYFNTRSSWGRHPSAYDAGAPQREHHDEDTGPWGQRRIEKEHPGDD